MSATMRTVFCSLAIFSFGNAVAAQQPAMPPRALVMGSTPALGTAHTSSRLPDTTLRARIRSYDGRILVSRPTPSSALVWLTDTTTARRDTTAASVFRIRFVDASAIQVTNDKGECLTLIPRESTIPLAFGRCDREPIYIYPAADDAIVAGQDGFWLISRMGMVGPGTISPLLMPRSNLRVWFRLDPVK